MSTETNVNVNQSAESHSDKNSAGVSYNNTIEASAGVRTGNDNANIGVEASVKTGTEFSAEGGLDGNNAYAQVNYSDTTEAHIVVDGEVQSHGVGVGGSVDAYVKSGTEVEGHISVGDKGVAAGGGVSVGTSVGVDAEATGKFREGSATAGAGVSVGEHFEAGGSGEATFKKGVATVGVSGDVAALVGVEVDLSVSIDTNQVVKDANVVAKETTKVADTAVKETTKVVNTVAKETTKVANDAGKAISKSAKKTGNSIKKAFKIK
jgi:hypothetical protein